MGVNKVVINDEVKLDLTNDSVTPEALAKGFTAHNAAGDQIVGTASTGTPVITTGTGAAYVATVSDVTSLVVGASFVMVPHTVSTSTAPTLNVNGLGAKQIKRRVSSSTAAQQEGYSVSWLSAGKPVRVMYDGSYWIVEELTKPAADDLYGTVPVNKGGTGANSAPAACENLGALSKTGGTMTGPLGLTQDVHYGSTEPDAPVEGQIFFKQINVAALVYPVGAIYTSTVATSPQTLFGFGTWERIQDTFLLAAGSAYAAGTTGGEATHTLTVGEMPKHSHSIFYPNAGGSASAAIGYPTTGSKNTWWAEASKVSETGGSAAHNNMPPYIAVYVWQRVA